MPILEGKSIAVDTMIMIYLLEKRQPHALRIAEILPHAERIIISTLVIGEVLTGMYRKNNPDEIESFFSFLSTQQHLAVRPFDQETSMIFGKLLSVNLSLRPPDCIHLATALHAKANIFLTNDKRIKTVKGLEIVHLEDL